MLLMEPSVIRDSGAVQGVSVAADVWEYLSGE
jgi:hypothetical protein